MFSGENISTRDDVKSSIKNFEKQNGSVNNFTVKDILIMTRGDINKLDIKLEEHLAWANKTFLESYSEMNTLFSKHEKIIQEITDKMPDKGWCDKVTGLLEIDKTPNLQGKVELLWNDRRWIKALLYVLIGMGGLNLLLLATKTFLLGT